MNKILLVLGINNNTMLFKDIFLQSYPSASVLEQDGGIPNLNSRDTLEMVRETWVDLIVSYGPERLSAEFIGLARLGGINAHWGLTPMYRGMHTARFALLQGKPEWVGITIHKLDATLDTGDIIYQARPELKIGDSYKMVEARLNLLVCEIMPKAVEEVLNGTVKTIKQDTSIGREYYNKEWTEECEKTLTPENIASCLEYREQVGYFVEEDVTITNDYFTLPRN